MFVDDILVYSPDMESHVKHLTSTLNLLRDNTLFAKRTKCSFVQSKVEYLGHIIIEHAVSACPAKIPAMLEWPKPSTFKALREFLG